MVWHCRGMGWYGIAWYGIVEASEGASQAMLPGPTLGPGRAAAGRQTVRPQGCVSPSCRPIAHLLRLTRSPVNKSWVKLLILGSRRVYGRDPWYQRCWEQNTSQIQILRHFENGLRYYDLICTGRREGEGNPHSAWRPVPATPPLFRTNSSA